MAGKTADTGVELDRILEHLSPLAEFVSGFAEFIGEVSDPIGKMRWTVSEIRVDLPVEMEILADDSGRVVLAGAPPTQQIETTFFPLLHRLRLGVVAGNGQERE